MNIHTSSNMTATAMQSDVRQSEVHAAFARAEEMAAFIEKIAEGLEVKLSQSILAQCALEAGSNQSTPEPVRVPIAQRLHEHGSKLESIRQHLDSILSRIEA